MYRHLGLITIILLSLASISLGKQAIPKGEPIALSMPGDFYMAPQWSPNGDQVAAAGPSYTGLFLIDFPSGVAIQLSNAYSAGYGFAWSHSGTRIASRIAHFDNMLRTNTLVSFNTEDYSTQLISEPRTRMTGTPLWSTTDSHVYLTNADKFESFHANNSRTTSLSESLFYVKDGQLLHRDTAGNNDRTLPVNQDNITSYAVSPDGSRIVYSTSGQKLWIANSDGSGQHSLGSGIAPDWSPDSKWIVFMLTEDDGHTMLGSELYLLDTDTETRLNISNTPDQLEMHPDWSPDGSWIVFDTEGRGQLFIQQVEWR
ncbi:MAG: hypothetical protein U9Q77_00120 [Candidatus Marinimicrobia bacterium]|nr:hypothetical protein [Candidatus Neomarinimicrobiota bacterium]